MKKKTYYFSLCIITFLLLTVFSCKNKIDKKEITIIDDVVLGKPKPSFEKYLDSLGIASNVFFTKPFFYNTDQNILDYRIKFWYTTRFNFSSYSTDKTSHLGLFYTINKSDAVVGLVVIIANIMIPALVYDVDQDKVSMISQEYGYGGISQSVCISELTDIQSKLQSKYGIPKIVEKKSNNYYVLEGNNINAYRTAPDSLFAMLQNELYVWETKYLDITFFNGITDFNRFYDTAKNEYYFGKKQNSTSILCNFGACITYLLKNETQKKLGLDKDKI